MAEKVVADKRERERPSWWWWPTGGAPPGIFWARAIFWAPPKIFWDSSKDVCERVKILWTPAKIKDKTCQVSSYAACADVMEKSI